MPNNPWRFGKGPVDSTVRNSRRGYYNFDNDEDRRNARFLDPMDVEYGYSSNADVGGNVDKRDKAKKRGELSFGRAIRDIGRPFTDLWSITGEPVVDRLSNDWDRIEGPSDRVRRVAKDFAPQSSVVSSGSYVPFRNAESRDTADSGWNKGEVVNQYGDYKDRNRMSLEEERKHWEELAYDGDPSKEQYYGRTVGPDGKFVDVPRDVNDKYFKEAPGAGPYRLPKVSGGGLSDSGSGGGGGTNLSRIMSPELNLENSNSDELIEYLRNNLNVKRDSVNLQPLMALSDTWFGGNLAGNYQDPHDEVLANSERDLKIMSAIDQTDKSDLDRRNNLAKALYNVERDKVGDKVQADRLKADDWYRKQKLEQDKQYNFLSQQLKAQELPKEVRAYYNWFNREGNDWKSPINKRIKSFVEAQSKGQKLSHEQTNELLLQTQEDIVDESRGYLLQNPGASPVEVFNYVANRYENALKGISKSDE